jgi:hypothetical protein
MSEPPAAMTNASPTVGKLIDRVPLKWVYVPVAAGQIPLFLFASQVSGWPHYAAMFFFMVFVFGAAGFTTLLTVLAVLAACTTFFASLLPTYAPNPTIVAAPTPEPAT